MFLVIKIENLEEKDSHFENIKLKEEFGGEITNYINNKYLLDDKNNIKFVLLCDLFENLLNKKTKVKTR